MKFTVGELKSILEDIPGDMGCIVAGFDECQIDDLEDISFKDIVRGAGAGGHSGEHEEACRLNDKPLPVERCLYFNFGIRGDDGNLIK